MGYLNINVEKIKELIELKTYNWDYPTSTNCYAYALGLDVPFNKISDHAYKLGCFSEDKLNSENKNVYSLDEEKRLDLDLDCLGLNHVEVDSSYKIDINDINYTYFLVAFFKGYKDFHFLRKSNTNDVWYHKKGYLDFPRYRDDDGKIIYDPKEAFFIHYNYVKTLRIGIKK